MTVNILGRDITAEIASFREVDFSTAGHRLYPVDEPRQPCRGRATQFHFDRLCRAEQAEAAILRDLASAFPQHHRDPSSGCHRPGVGRFGRSGLGHVAMAQRHHWLTGFLVLDRRGGGFGRQAHAHMRPPCSKRWGLRVGAYLMSFALRSVPCWASAAGLVALMAGVTGGLGGQPPMFWRPGFAVIWPSALGHRDRRNA